MLVEKGYPATRRPTLEGLHHVAARIADASSCRRFYGGVLGLTELPPSLGYEIEAGETLSFGDPLARTGGILTFMVDPRAPQGRPGAGMAHTVRWRVAGAPALEFWRERLGAIAEVAPSQAREDVVRFRAPGGITHELVIDASPDEPLLAVGEDIPDAMALRGLDGVRIYARERVPSADLLAGRLDFKSAGPGGSFAVGGRLRQGCYIADEPPEARGVPGVGTVDHVAWASEERYLAIWRQRVIGVGARVSPIEDGGYFRSFRFREPSGVMFEIATRGRTHDPLTEELPTFTDSQAPGRMAGAPA